MALKFLSKKRWHVRRVENIRKVAEAEAKHAEEQTRMAELRREREEEREMEDIRRIQEASGRIPKHQQRVEFLYKTPVVRKQSEEDIITREEILANRRSDSVMQSEALVECQRQEVPGVKWLDGLKAAKGDGDLRVQEDPMTAILARRQREKQEAEERKAFLKKLQDGEAAESSGHSSHRHHQHRR
jgi:hypothetical protein